MTQTGVMSAALIILATACSSSPLQRDAEVVATALAHQPRFRDVRVEYLEVPWTSKGVIGLTGLVEGERDAWDARELAWTVLGGGGGVTQGIFMAMRSREPGMSRLGIPWCAVPSSCDGWEQALRLWGPAATSPPVGRPQ